MTIFVYHYGNGSSDKYWAIDDKPDESGNLSVWWGRRGQTLQHQKRSGAKSWVKLVDEKLQKGYVQKPSLTVDTDALRVVHTTDVADLPQEQVSRVETSNSLLFSIKPVLDEVESTLSKEIPRLQSDFNIALQDFDESFANFAVRISDTINVDDIDQSCFGEISYDEGPIAALLLLVLRRKLAVLGFKVNIVLNSNSEPLPDELNQCDAVFAEIRSQWLLSNTESADNGIKAEKIRNVCSMLADRSFFKKLCVAVGARQAPIDLSSIEAPSSAAFF